MSRYALLVGYGSIGKRHLQELVSRNFFVSVVDPWATWDDLIQSPNVRAYRALADSSAVQQQFDIVVVATWGPLHYQIINELDLLEFPLLFLEKPSVSKYGDIEKVNVWLQNKDVKCIENLHLRHSPVGKYLASLPKTSNFGLLQHVVVHGGALCIATNGIHYLDLVSHIMQQNPTQVVANLHHDRINPRHPDYVYLGGTSTWTYPDSRSLTIAFNNNSYASAEVDFYFKSAAVRLSSSTISIREPEDAPILNSVPVTRHRPFSRTIDEIDFSQHPSGMTAIYDTLESNDVNLGFPRLGDTTAHLLFALAASHQMRALTIGDAYPSELVEHDWQIS